LQGSTVERIKEASILHKGLGRVEAFDFAREGLSRLRVKSGLFTKIVMDIANDSGDATDYYAYYYA